MRLRRQSRFGEQVWFHAFDLGSLRIGRLFDKKSSTIDLHNALLQ
jgi:hypothetical protein